jgi:tetratricopeptide (TPR) repeat protein
MNKNRLIILIGVLLLIVLASVFYFYNNKKTEIPNNDQEQQGTEQNNQQISTTEEIALRTKILELVGIANEGKIQEALSGYLALEKNNPNDLMLLNNIADLYSDLSNWTKAEEYYKKVLSSNPTYINGYRMLAYLYQYRFNDDEVKIKALIDDGLIKTNNDQGLLSWIIDYYQQKNEGEKALPYSKLLTEQLNK